MAGYRPSLYLSWANTAGTIRLEADFRTFSYNPAIDLIEETAGADAAKVFIAGIKSGQAQLTAVDQSGSMAVWSTALLEGAFGTLTYGPEGTVAGKFKQTFAAFSLGSVLTWTYNDTAQLQVTFQQSGARTDGVW
jgi:hypothetical protein